MASGPRPRLYIAVCAGGGSRNAGKQGIDLG
jgi:hypothetical protein